MFLSIHLSQSDAKITNNKMYGLIKYIELFNTDLVLCDLF